MFYGLFCKRAMKTRLAPSFDTRLENELGIMHDYSVQSGTTRLADAIFPTC
jgi:hypothetical protein